MGSRQHASVVPMSDFRFPVVTGELPCETTNQPITKLENAKKIPPTRAEPSRAIVPTTGMSLSIPQPPFEVRILFVDT